MRVESSRDEETQQDAIYRPEAVTVSMGSRLDSWLSVRK